jgi:hypothetical protein
MYIIVTAYSPEGYGHVRKANSVDTGPRFAPDEYSRSEIIITSYNNNYFL